MHLPDKEDGAVDGLPETLLQKKYNQKWIALIETNMDEIASGYSDIDTYAATGPAEFFSVVSEYFFNKPGKVEKNYPVLHDMLNLIYEFPKG